MVNIQQHFMDMLERKSKMIIKRMIVINKWCWCEMCHSQHWWKCDKHVCGTSKSKIEPLWEDWKHMHYLIIAFTKHSCWRSYCEIYTSITKKTVNGEVTTKQYWLKDWRYQVVEMKIVNGLSFPKHLRRGIFHWIKIT